MKRKRVVKLPQPDNMSVADALVVIEQSIAVNVVMQRGIDPNEAFEEWEANKDNLLACSQAVHAILEQYGDSLDDFRLELPEGLGLGGYRVDDLDVFGKADRLPF